MTDDRLQIQTDLVKALNTTLAYARREALLEAILVAEAHATGPDAAAAIRKLADGAVK